MPFKMKSQNNLRTTPYLLVFLLLLSLFSACKKENNSSNTTATGTYYMRFKANGTQVEFTNQQSLVAAFSNTGNQYVGIFTGYDANSNMGLQVYDNKAIATGTYTGYAAVGSVLVGTLISYQTSNSSIYGETGMDTTVVVNINELTSTAVKGTFNGILSGQNDSMVITNGEFYLHRVN